MKRAIKQTRIASAIRGVIVVITVFMTTACFASVDVEEENIYLSESAIDMMIVGNNKGAFKLQEPEYEMVNRNSCSSCYESNLSYHRFLIKKMGR